MLRKDDVHGAIAKFLQRWRGSDGVQATGVLRQMTVAAIDVFSRFARRACMPEQRAFVKGEGTGVKQSPCCQQRRFRAVGRCNGQLSTCTDTR
jgi:hypothetical protein